MNVDRRLVMPSHAEMLAAEGRRHAARRTRFGVPEDTDPCVLDFADAAMERARRVVELDPLPPAPPSRAVPCDGCGEDLSERWVWAFAPRMCSRCLRRQHARRA